MNNLIAWTGTDAEDSGKSLETSLNKCFGLHHPRLVNAKYSLKLTKSTTSGSLDKTEDAKTKWEKSLAALSDSNIDKDSHLRNALLMICTNIWLSLMISTK
jgi:hypothetical protein